MNKTLEYKSQYYPEITYTSDKNFIVRLKVLIEKMGKEFGHNTMAGRFKTLLESLDNAEDYLFASKQQVGPTAETELTKTQAIVAMSQGKKVRHKYFDDDEWVTMEGNTMVMEDGAKCSEYEFWSIRTQESWETGWFIVSESTLSGQNKNETAEEDQFIIREFDSNQYYWCKCENCGWEDSSQFCEGCHQIADTGDHSDPLCPICGCNKIDGDPTIDTPSYEGTVKVKIPIDTVLAPYKKHIAGLEKCIEELRYKEPAAVLQHTDGEWAVGYGEKSMSLGIFTKKMLDKNLFENPICLISNVLNVNDTDKANAERIVMCCNGWDELIKERDMLKSNLQSSVALLDGISKCSNSDLLTYDYFGPLIQKFKSIL